MAVDDLKRVRGAVWATVHDAIAGVLEMDPEADAVSLCEAAMQAAEAAAGQRPADDGTGDVSLLRALAGSWPEDDFPEPTAGELAKVPSGMADRISAAQARRFSDLAARAADALEAASSLAVAQAARISALEARVAALEGDDPVTPESADEYWRRAVGGPYSPAVWGKHEAVHPARVREALVLAAAHAPACGDVIVALLHSQIVAGHRLRLVAQGDPS